jgi:hypothetical protein
VARAAAIFFGIGVLQRLAQDFGLERLLAEQAVQFADLLLKRAVVRGRHHLLAGRRGREGAMGGEATPGEELVRVHAMAARNQADRGARLQAANTNLVAETGASGRPSTAAAAAPTSPSGSRSPRRPSPPGRQREFAAEVAWDLPNLAPGATSLLDVTITGSRQGDLAQASLANSTRFIELDATAWSNNTVRVMARNISPTATFDLPSTTLSVAVTKRRVP